jgi:hypothetical protein
MTTAGSRGQSTLPSSPQIWGFFSLENSTQVMIVSLTKPVKERTCFDDSKCKTSFILSVIGTALGLIATLGNIVKVSTKVLVKKGVSHELCNSRPISHSE